LGSLKKHTLQGCTYVGSLTSSIPPGIYCTTDSPELTHEEKFNLEAYTKINEIKFYNKKKLFEYVDTQFQKK